MARHEVIVAISPAAQRQAVLDGKPSEIIQHYPLSSPEEINEALRNGAFVDPDGNVVLRWCVVTSNSAPRADWSRSSSYLQIRPHDARHAMQLIAEAKRVTASSRKEKAS